MKYLYVTVITEDWKLLSLLTEITDDELEIIKPLIAENKKRKGRYITTLEKYMQKIYYEKFGTTAIDIFNDCLPKSRERFIHISDIRLLEVSSDTKLIN